jgi:hypothetical protein
VANGGTNPVCRQLDSKMKSQFCQGTRLRAEMKAETTHVVASNMNVNTMVRVGLYIAQVTKQTISEQLGSVHGTAAGDADWRLKG